jgi:membrane-bound lytic murein transglycosylase B
VRIAGGLASAAFAKVRRHAERTMRGPALGIAVIAPLVLASAVGASAPSLHTSVDDNGITPLAAVAHTGDGSGATVVAAMKMIEPLRFATANVSPPPPAVVVNSPGSLRIPAMALNAYQNAERLMAAAVPGCGISWNLLAGIGRIESMHANGGATDAHGTAIYPIYGPVLDGTLAGNEVIVQSVQAGRVTFARAMGPMQFLPGTWARYASDGDGDGKADVQNLYDSALAAARYLCSGGLNLRDQSQVITAILRYNNSVAYARNVLGWAAAYATGVVPVNLPPIVGPAPPIGDAHLDSNPEGLGPGLPLNAAGLPSTDPLALNALMPDTASRLTPGPLPGPGSAAGQMPQQNCQVFCLVQQPQVPQQNCQVFCLVSQPPSVPPSELPPTPDALPAPLAPPPFGPPSPPVGPTPEPELAPSAPPGPVPGPAN